MAYGKEEKSEHGKLHHIKEHHSGHMARKAHEPHSLTHKGAHVKSGGFMTSPMKKNLK